MKWISANKRKPKPQTEVLVYAPNSTIIGPILIGQYFRKEKNSDESWTVYDFNESKMDQVVTHWMPLPKKP